MGKFEAQEREKCEKREKRANALKTGRKMQKIRSKKNREVGRNFVQNRLFTFAFTFVSRWGSRNERAYRVTFTLTGWWKNIFLLLMRHFLKVISPVFSKKNLFFFFLSFFLPFFLLFSLFSSHVYQPIIRGPTRF